MEKEIHRIEKDSLEEKIYTSKHYMLYTQYILGFKKVNNKLGFQGTLKFCTVSE